MLLLLASGIRPHEVSLMIEKRYKKPCNKEQVWRARYNHPREFYQCLTFYRDIFLKQHVQGLEQKISQKLDMALKKIDVDSVSDFAKMTAAWKNVNDVSKSKEADGTYTALGKEAIVALEDKMKTMLGK